MLKTQMDLSQEDQIDPFVSNEELFRKLDKGIDDIRNGRVVPIEVFLAEVNERMKKDGLL